MDKKQVCTQLYPLSKYSENWPCSWGHESKKERLVFEIFFHHTCKCLACLLIKFKKMSSLLNYSKINTRFSKKFQHTYLFLSARLRIFKKMPVCPFILFCSFIRDFRVYSSCQTLGMSIRISIHNFLTALLESGQYWNLNFWHSI